MRASLMDSVHSPPMAAHGGIGKTIDRLRRFCYWPRMTVDVRQMVNECNICRETKAPNVTLRPPMGQQMVAERPFQLIYSDLLGPYPRSKTGHTYILVVLDKFTKFVLLHPLRKASASEVKSFLEHNVIQMFGVPKTLYTDNGVQYRSNEFTQMVNQYGTRISKPLPVHCAAPFTAP